MIEQGIVSLLNANAPLMATINRCIYPVFVPQDASYPCLSYQVISTTASYDFQGESTTESRIQFDAWAEDYMNCKTIQKALRAVIDAYDGVLSEGTRVLGAFRSLETDFFEPDSRMYRALSEYTFHYVEP